MEPIIFRMLFSIKNKKNHDVVSLLYIWLDKKNRALNEILSQMDITENAFSRVFSNKRQFQNEFMKTSFLPKYEQKLSGFLPSSVVRAEILTIFVCILRGMMTS